MKQPYGLQLFLSEEDNRKLLPIITQLQQTYEQAPPFTPHLTIYTLINAELNELIETVNKVTASTKQFVVEKSGFGHQASWAKMLYIQIADNENLSKLHQNLVTALEQPDTRPFDPHISLLYKDSLLEVEHEQIISKLAVPNSFTISSLNILSAGEDNVTWRDYTKWRVEYTKVFD